MAFQWCQPYIYACTCSSLSSSASPSPSIRSKMSTAFFCSSLPARPFGHKDGRGTTDRVRTPAIVRLPANPSAQACRLKRWNICHSDVATADPSIAQSSIDSNGGITIEKEESSAKKKELSAEIDKDFEPFLLMHKKGGVGRLGRFNGDGYVKGSLVLSKDVDVVVEPKTQTEPDTTVKVRIYLPHVNSPPADLPILVYFHGGAFIVEDIASPPYHNYLNKLAEEANILIVSVNYRLAPEKSLPVAYKDCMETIKWVNKHSGGKGQEEWINKYGNVERLFLSGDSAGGNITHNMAIDPEAPDNIEGIALIHPYFFGKVPTETELQDPTNLLLHRKLWSFIAPKSEGLDDPQVNPLGPTAKSLKEKSLTKVKCKRAVVFVAGEDFHKERAALYNEELTKALGDKVWQLCNHDGVGHVYHLSADAEVEEIERQAAWKLMTNLLKLYEDNGVVLQADVVRTLETQTKKAIEKMKDTEKAMAKKMMKQLVAFFEGDKDKFVNAN